MNKLVKKTICAECNADVPEDSLFCPYCGSKNIKSSFFDNGNNRYKKCVNCNELVPNDALYCQYCGKKTDIKQIEEPAYSNISSSQQSIKQRSFFIPFVLATVICFLMGISWYYSSIQKTDSRISQMTKYLNETETYTDFNSNKTVLYKPRSEKVLIYANIGDSLMLSFEASSEDVVCYWDDEWDGNTIGLNITYTKTGVEYVKITNNLNSNSFYILLIG